MPLTRERARHSFGKEERLCGQKRIESLFASGNRSLAAYPLRAVYLVEDREGEPVQVLVTAPKRLLRHAVERNRAKRLVREAYRLNKHMLTDALGQRKAALAFMWIGREQAPFAKVEAKVKNLLQRIAEDLATKQAEDAYN